MEFNYQEMIAEIFSDSGYFQLNKNLLRCFGPEKAVFITNLVDKYKHFKEKEKIQDDWFFQTHEVQMEETGLSEYAIKKHKKACINDGLLETKMFGMPRKEWYKLNLIAIYETVQEYKEKKKSESFAGLVPSNSGGQEGINSGGQDPPSSRGHNKNISNKNKIKKTKKYSSGNSVLYPVPDTDTFTEKNTTDIKNFVGDIYKFTDYRARSGIKISKEDRERAWKTFESLPDNDSNKILLSEYIEHESQKWDFSKTKHKKSVLQGFCVEYFEKSPNAKHFLYCYRNGLLDEDLKHYPKRNKVRQKEEAVEDGNLFEMWEAEG